MSTCVLVVPVVVVIVVVAEVVIVAVVKVVVLCADRIVGVVVLPGFSVFVAVAIAMAVDEYITYPSFYPRVLPCEDRDGSSFQYADD